MSMIGNLMKAGISIAVTPVAVLVDIATLPASAYNDEEPFKRTGQQIKNAGRCLNEATKPEVQQV